MVFKESMSAILLYVSTLLIAGLWVWAQWHAAGLEFSQKKVRLQWTIAAGLLFLVILTCTLALGASGWLARFELTPPPGVALVPLVVAAAFYVGLSRFGTLLVKHTPLTLLVGFHAFRLLAEMVILSGFLEGVAPRALSFHGWNFDIVTALSAVPVAWLARGNRNLKLVWWWNSMALGFLVAIAFIALFSMPIPVRLFLEEPGNQWVTRLPYTLLPGILVVAALAGQILIYRKLKFLRA